MSENKVAISCQSVWKVFGSNPESVFDMANNGASKQEILEQTGHVIAVKNVSFEVYENEIFVIMGLSGSGKSTLVRCINRLIEPTKGAVLIEGTDIAKMDDNELRNLRRHKLSMVFQYFGLLPHRMVEENVAFGLEIRGDRGKQKETRVAQALETVGLKGWENSHIDELSGSMQQRVGHIPLRRRIGQRGRQHGRPAAGNRRVAGREQGKVQQGVPPDGFDDER